MASTYTSLHVHAIFATKDRAPMIDASWLRELHGYVAGTAEGLGAQSLAVGGVVDHVHVLMGIRAAHAVADLVREIKKASSIWAAERYAGFAWQTGYGAFAVSPRDVDMVRKYIARQEEHHRTISSADELRAILEQFGVPFDERYFE